MPTIGSSLRNHQLTPWERHVKLWSKCTACPLCQHRIQVVLARGQLPCEALFIGQSPGRSEDVTGKPFKGPAGQLLDDIIVHALQAYGKPVTTAFTNIVACIPKVRNEEGQLEVLKEPTKQAITACNQRLREIVIMARPQLIVLVGDTAQKHGYVPEGTMHVGLIHPSHILQNPEVNQGLLIQKSIIILADALEATFG